MKIKTFEFWVSNNQSIRKATNANYEARYDHPDVSSFADIDKTINAFCEYNKVTNILVNDIVMHRHNNAGADTIKRTYTILYE